MKKQPKQDGQRLSGQLEKIEIQGFKSLKDVALQLPHRGVNVLIGANGAGKSNILEFFEMLSWMMNSGLREYVSRKGGCNDLLFNGLKRTQSVYARLWFHSDTGQNEYQFRLQPTEDGGLMFGQEQYRFTRTGESERKWNDLGIGHREANITGKELRTPAHITRRMLRNCHTYQFHDTSATAPIKTAWNADDVHILKHHGGNLAPILLDLRENLPGTYDEIVRTIQQVLPYFKDFDLEILYGKVKLRWLRQDADKVFGPHLTSDGTLRFMALAALLCMPPDKLLSDIIVLDEPELGLHPYAISLVGALIKRLAKDKQIIVATQSPLLLNVFDAGDIVVTEMTDNGTEFKRKSAEELQHWLEDSPLGEIWESNYIGGNP